MTTLSRADLADRRVLFVHAHPDDEAIATGATIARYAAEGAHVTIVTCTLGEEATIVVPELEHLHAAQSDALGAHRQEELAAAMKALGVHDHRYLGGPGRYRDSGMADAPTNDRPDSFWRADLDEAMGHLVDVVREVRPQVVVTYDENGGYGHPDHIRAHQVAVGAFDRAADPSFAAGTGEPWQPSKLYYTVVPRSLMQQAIDYIIERGMDLFEGVTSAEDIPFAVPDDVVTTEVDGSAYLDAKLAAMRAHVSQIDMNDPLFALFEDRPEGGPTFGHEHYVLVAGPRGPGSGPNGWEQDLFEGLG